MKNTHPNFKSVATLIVCLATLNSWAMAMENEGNNGYEESYNLFVRGKLIYKPDPNSDTGRIELPISALANPLEGTFDLSQCRDSGEYLSINTGYRKGKKAENANKLEIWIAPRFLIEKELSTTASHFQYMMEEWDSAAAPVGLLWTWGGWDNKGWYDHLTTNSLEQTSDNNLYEKWIHPTMNRLPTPRQSHRLAIHMERFYVSFLN